MADFRKPDRDVRLREVKRRPLIDGGGGDAGRAGTTECLADCDPIARAKRLDVHQARIRQELRDRERKGLEPEISPTEETDEEVESLLDAAERNAAGLEEASVARRSSEGRKRRKSRPVRNGGVVGQGG